MKKICRACSSWPRPWSKIKNNEKQSSLLKNTTIRWPRNRSLSVPGIKLRPISLRFTRDLVPGPDKPRNTLVKHHRIQESQVAMCEPALNSCETVIRSVKGCCYHESTNPLLNIWQNGPASGSPRFHFQAIAGAGPRVLRQRSSEADMGWGPSNRCFITPSRNIKNPSEQGS